MKPSVIVWDLETVPDLAGFAAVHDLVDKSDVEVREASGVGARPSGAHVGGLTRMPKTDQNPAQFCAPRCF
jgi:hypothetical protein